MLEDVGSVLDFLEFPLHFPQFQLEYTSDFNFQGSVVSKAVSLNGG